MAELTEDQIKEYDKLNTKHENAAYDLDKFQTKLAELQTQYEVLVINGYKTPEERKEMAKNDSVYYGIQSLQTDIETFQSRVSTYSSELEVAKASGYLTPTERVAKAAAAAASAE